jgi:hypothetical protein
VGQRGELLGQRGTGGSPPRVLGKALEEFLCKAIPHYLENLVQIWDNFKFIRYISLVFSFH